MKPQEQIPYGYQRKTKGKLLPGDQVWMPKYRQFRTPDTQAFSLTVRDYLCVIERIPIVPRRGYHVHRSDLAGAWDG